MSGKRNLFDQHDLESFVDGYVDAALWSSHDESDESGGEPMDKNHNRHDIARSSMASIKRECAKFVKQNQKVLSEYVLYRKHDASQGNAMAYAGHDFWLDRNGHGTGFWDRDYNGHDEIGEKLSEASKKFGSSDLYVGDDGKLYVSPER